jgi:hypothetical protein
MMKGGHSFLPPHPGQASDQATIDGTTPVTLTLEAAMQLVRTWRFLTLSTVIALGTALTLACSDGGPTAPDQAASFASGKASYVDDDGSYYCPANYLLANSGYKIYTGYSVYDVNQNAYICEYHQGSGGGRALTVDDDGNQHCKNGYNLGFTGSQNYWDLWDFNGNDYVCTLAPKL